MLYTESQTALFVDAVRKLKEELRRAERKTRQARQKARATLRKTPARPS